MGIPVKRSVLSRWDQHFATLPDAVMMQALQERFDDHIARLKSTNQYQRMVRVYHEFYSEGLNGEDNTYISQSGVQGERTLVHVAHMRQLIESLVNLATSEKPNYEAEATSTEAESLKQAKLANGIADWYLDDHLMEDITRSVLIGLIFSESWIDSVWDKNLGPDSRVIDTPEGPQIVKAGDTDTWVYTPMECAVDPFSRKRNDPDWCILVRWVNRYKLMTLYPDKKDEISMLPDGEQSEAEFDFDTGLFLNSPEHVRVYMFFHKDNTEVPGGRYMYYAGGKEGVVLEGGPSPYGSELPIDRFAVQDIVRGAAGWTPAFDMLPLVEAISAQYSHILSNHTAFGTQVILAEKGHGLNYDDIATGLAFLEHEPGKKPEAANYVKSPPEMFTFLKLLEETLNVLSGVHGSLRGQGEAKSGSHAAMLHSTAMQMTAGVQGTTRRVTQGVLTKRIRNLQRFGTIERTVEITGKDKITTAHTFNSENVERVKRYVVRPKNPMMDTEPGRMELIQILGTMPNIQLNMSEIITFIQTGRMEPMWEGTDKFNMAIRQENEALRNKAAPIPHVAPWEPHDRHIFEHAADIADPERRSDESLFRRYVQHIQEHIEKGKLQGHPAIVALFGTVPLMPGTVPPPAPGDGSNKTDESPGPDAEPPGAEGMTGRPANLPNMPQNPETGQRPPPQAGTPARP